MFKTGYSTTVFINEKHDSIFYEEYKCPLCNWHCCIDSSFVGAIDCPYCVFSEK